jgi:hypothetical protein
LPERSSCRHRTPKRPPAGRRRGCGR